MAWLVTWMGDRPCQGSTPSVGSLSQSKQLHRSTRPWSSDYRPKGGDTLLVGKGGYGSCLVAGGTVWSYLSALEATFVQLIAIQ